MESQINYWKGDSTDVKNVEIILKKKTDNVSILCLREDSKAKINWLFIGLYYLISMLHYENWTKISSFSRSFLLPSVEFRIVRIFGTKNFLRCQINIFITCNMCSNQHFISPQGTTFRLSKRLKCVIQQWKLSLLTVKATHTFLWKYLNSYSFR